MVTLKLVQDMKTEYQKDAAFCYAVLAKSFKGAIMNTEAVMMGFSTQGGITTQVFTVLVLQKLRTRPWYYTLHS
jgi:hypothetical protein